MHIRLRQQGLSLVRLLGVMLGLIVLAGVVFLFLPADKVLPPNPSTASNGLMDDDAAPDAPLPPAQYTVEELQRLQPSADADAEVKDLVAAGDAAIPPENAAVEVEPGVATEPESASPDSANSPAGLPTAAVAPKQPLSLAWQGQGDLNSSDGPVRQVLASLDPSQQMLSWLVDEELIRRFVVLVDNLANGTIPAKHMVFKAPKGELRVVPLGENYRLVEANYERYNSYLQLISGLPPKTVVSAYQQFYPLLQEAYAELGYPRQSFHHRLLEAIEVVLNTPMPEANENLVLTRPSVMYEYQDQELEQDSDIRKQMLRMGLGNSALLKDSLWQWKRLLIQLDHR